MTRPPAPGEPGEPDRDGPGSGRTAPQPGAGETPAETPAEPADEFAAEPAGHTAPEPAGHPEVDAAVRGVEQVADAPPADQIPAYQAAYRALQETLTSIDES